MSDLGSRAPSPTRKRLGSSRPITLEPIRPVDPDQSPEAETASADPAKPAATEAPSTQEAPATSTQAAAPAPAKPARAPRTRPTPPEAPAVQPAAVEANSAATKGITLRLGKPLYKRLTAYKTAEGLSYPTVVLLAVQSTYNQLPQLLAARSVQIDSGGPNLFRLPTQVARRSETAAEDKEQLPIKISRERRTVLSQLVDSTGAPSLNELVCTALEAFLPEAV